MDIAWISARSPGQRGYEQGSVELEYRGALHWGLPDAAFDPLRQSHELEGDANVTAFGPIVEVVNGPISLILDPLFIKQLGEFADQQGLGFQYGWQLKYEMRSRWTLALEMFGEIDDLANAGPFTAQNHSLGPTLYYTFGGGAGSEEAGKISAGADKTGEDAPDPSQLTVDVGLQFGLTEATSDVALKLDGQFKF